MSEKFVVDGESVRGLAKLLEETGLSEIEYQVGTQRVRVVRALPQATFQTLPASISPIHHPAALSNGEAKPAIAPAPQGEPVNSPIVGMAYLAAEPGAEPFIKVGSSVKKGDTLLIVEAMKVMNPIRAPRDGRVIEICIQDGNPVEFGEPLIILE